MSAQTSPPPELKAAAIFGEPEWLSAARQLALDRFTQTGLPTTKDEDWRFTNVSPVSELSFQPADRWKEGAITSETFPQLALSRFANRRLVFVDGHYARELSSVAEHEGVTITSLTDAIAHHPAQLEMHLFRSAEKNTTPFAALNTALFQDGAFIHITKDQKIAEPIQIYHIATAEAAGNAVYPRCLIVVEKGTVATITESYLSFGEASRLTSAMTEIVVGDNATIEYLKFQDESPAVFHFGKLAIRAGRDSHTDLHSMAFGAKLSRTNIRATLAGEGAECILNGLYLVGDERTADHYMIVDHVVPHGTSHEYFNGILSDKAKGVFHGRIIVQPDAQKTDAKQTNKNLLLSDDATVDTKPQLEIYADDVKCTHGATVGQLSDEALFYLRSRGIPLDKARQMLIYAFAGEIIDRIRCEPLRRELAESVLSRLP
jgi:Fe-S cluster assembly protein SufD